MSIAPRRSGFRELYDEHYAFVWHTVRRFGVPAMLAEDAVQDTFVTAFRKREDFDGQSARAWLYGIGRRIASNHRRGQARATRRHQLAREATSAPRAAEDLIVAKTLVDSFLATLRPADRELFVLSEVDGLTGPELASLSGRKLGTLYSRIRAVRRRFEAFVSERGECSEEALAQARRARPAASAAGWLALAPRLALATSTAHGAAGWLGIHAGGYLFGGGLAMGALLCVRMVTGAPAPPAPREAEALLAGVSAAPAEREASSSSPAHEPDAVAVVAAPRGAATTARPARPSRQRPRRTTATATSTDLAADLALLRAADRSLKHGDPARALAQLDAHAERFASSPQADLRAALRVEALCARGRAAEARAAARALLEARPTTPVARRIRMSCVEQP